MLREAQNLAGRLQSLRRKHLKLEAEISHEATRPVPDGVRLRALKRIKLQTMDQIERIRRMLAPSGRIKAAT